MSMRDSINRLLGSELTCLESEFFGNESPRDVFVSADVASLVLGPWPDTTIGRRHARARGVLDGFIEGDEIAVGWSPFKKSRTSIMARVAPIESGVFDFRCLDPNPGIRILGLFSEIDTFIAICWDYRENLDADGAWEEKVKFCKAEWMRLFKDAEPLMGNSIDDYISFNAFAV